MIDELRGTEFGDGLANPDINLTPATALVPLGLPGMRTFKDLYQPKLTLTHDV
jgi:hypothetical protein